MTAELSSLASPQTHSGHVTLTSLMMARKYALISTITDVYKTKIMNCVINHVKDETGLKLMHEYYYIISIIIELVSLLN